MPPTPRLRVDPLSSVPVVRQITDGLRVFLVERRIAPGTQLPSVRRLAMELAVHFNTVAEAYRQLAAEGWLELKRGRAAVVVDRAVPLVKSRAWTGDFRDRLRRMVAEMRADGVPPGRIAAELHAMAEAVKR